MASQSRPFHMGGSNAGGVDTTFTKIFVGGLAWETQRDTMSRYFQQFGDILEAVVITDKNTGRSKGYGFVTFKEQDSAMRACQNPSPVIDGRRANCNLASIGASNRTQYGMGRMRSQATSAAYRGLSASSSSISTGYIHQPTNYAFPYYGYSGGYPQETMYPLNYYGIGTGSGQQQYQHHFSPYYPANPGVYPNYYPYYVQYPNSAQPLHYPQMLQYPYSPQQFGSGLPILSTPAPVSAPTAGLTSGAVVVSSPSQPMSSTA